MEQIKLYEFSHHLSLSDGRMGKMLQYEKYEMVLPLRNVFSLLGVSKANFSIIPEGAAQPIYFFTKGNGV